MITTTLPSYLYQQYGSDPDLQAFFTAYNSTSQGYLDAVNSLKLPIYTSSAITGVLLDWVGNSLYGIPRPYITTGTSSLSKGVYDTSIYDTIPYNEGIVTSTQIPIVSMTWSSGVVTVTVASIYNLTGLSSGNIQGVGPSGYNGNFVFTSSVEFDCVMIHFELKVYRAYNIKVGFCNIIFYKRVFFRFV